MTGPSGYLFADTVTVLRASVTTDEYGNEVADWSNPAQTNKQARIEPGITTGATSELERDRATLIGEWQLFLPADADIDGHDRVLHEGELFEVVGPPALMRTPSGPHHWFARLRHVSG